MSVFRSQILQNLEINIDMRWKFCRKYGSVSLAFTRFSPKLLEPHKHQKLKIVHVQLIEYETDLYFRKIEKDTEKREAVTSLRSFSFNDDFSYTYTHSNAN